MWHINTAQNDAKTHYEVNKLMSAHRHTNILYSRPGATGHFKTCIKLLRETSL